MKRLQVLLIVVLTIALYGCGGSNAAPVVATPTAPVFSTQPTNQTVTAGQAATFTVTASGTAPLSYQWTKNGAAISGATAASYTTAATVMADSGAVFKVTVTNSAGNVTSNAATLTVNPAPPAITTQPASQSVTLGQTATFGVVATGTAPLTYQWNKGGTAISGATASSYTTPATIAGDNGASFTVTVTNAASAVTSSAAVLTVNIPPSVTTQPANQTVLEGQTASFSVTASGTAPLSYQWKKNGTAIVGATSSSFTTAATVIASDNGASFTVTITNAVGNVTSSAATLTVNPAPPAIATQPTSQTVLEGQAASFSVTATGTAPLSYQWKKGGVAIVGATASSYTTPATVLADSGSTFTVTVSNTAGNATSGAATLTVNPVPPAITTQPANQSVLAGATASFSVTANGSAPLSYQWSKNGTAIVGATTSSYTTPATSFADNGATFTVRVTNAGGSVTSNPATLTVNIAPAVTAQPANQTVLEGQTASFSVTATGTAPLTYQWKKNGTAIAGATANSHTTPATVIASDNGASFTVTITNAFGNVTSSAATLTVNPAPPAITVQPASRTAVDGQTASFSVTATGTAPLSYQWKKGGVAIVGATASSYTTPATVFASDNGASFTVTVTNAAGNVTSSVATLTVTPISPAITTQPSNQSVLVGATASFSVTATGTAPLSYQWSKNGTAIVGATSSSYTTPATSFADNTAIFTVQVTNAGGNVTSSAATLTVNAPPAITTQPANQTVLDGQTATFSVVAVGTPPLTYQWSKGGVAIVGATSSSLTTPATVLASDNGASFSVTITNAFGNVTSSAATLTVNAVPPGITSEPGNQAVLAGQTATFSVTATGSAPLSYQWSKGGVAIVGATSSSYTTPATVVADNGSFFTVVVSNAGGNVTSNIATLTVVGAPAVLAFTTQPTSTVAGATMTPAMQVSIRDQNNNTVTTASGVVTLVIQSGPIGATLSGTTTVAAVAGVATFPTLSLAKAGSYTLTATSAALSNATSNSFNVAAAASTNLVFTVQPTNTRASAFITPAVQVSLQDAFGNTTGSPDTIVISKQSGPGLLSGTLSRSTVAGVASFADLTLDQAGTYSLHAHASTAGLDAFSASLTVVGPPSLTASFGVASIPLNGSTSLTFIINNPNTSTLTGIGFNNTLPAGLVISTPNGLSSTCGGGTTATQGTSLISLAAASLPPAGSCTLSVNVTGIASGQQNNTSGAITSTEGGTGGTASASVLVGAPTFQVSGQIGAINGGPGLAGVTVSINTTPSQTALTDNTGNFSFGAIPNGSYTLSPSITGPSSVFLPSSLPVTVSGASVFNNSFQGELGFTVAGTVNYAGPLTGRIYLQLQNNNFCGGTTGTSIAAAGGAFTIHGVCPGVYTLSAWMDNVGHGVQNASNPTGSVAVTVGSVDVLGQTVTLTNPAAVDISASLPGLRLVSPSNEGAVAFITAVKNVSGVETATNYTIQWSTDGTFNTGVHSQVFPAITGSNGGGDPYIMSTTNGLTGLSGTLFFRVNALNATSSTGFANYPGNPVTIAAPAGANTVSGTVTFTGSATGPLYAGCFDQVTSKVYAIAIASPVSPAAYSVSGIPTGTNCFMFGIVDQNHSGVIDAGDFSNTDGNSAGLTVSGNTTQSFTLPSANAIATLNTAHIRTVGQPSDFYNLNFQVRQAIKMAVGLQMTAGPNVLVPVDIEKNSSHGFNFFPSSGTVRPIAGDTYHFTTSYSDATSEVLQASVTTVLDTFVQSMSQTLGTTPTFSWTAPATPPLGYTYQFSLSDTNGSTIWQVPGNNSNVNGLPNSVTSLTWDADPTDSTNHPSVPALTTGANYNWMIMVMDASGNSAQLVKSFTP